METKFDIALMVKVAQMYYIDGLKQEEIAKQVQISRSLISMILTEAKEVGIVEVNVRNPLQDNEYVSTRLTEEFHLQSCIAVPTSVQDIPVLRKLVAQRAVDLVNQLVESQMTIGLAWGRTCYEFVSHFRTDKSLNGISVLPLIGGSDQTASYYQLNEMVRVLADKLNGTAQFIHAPAITFTREEREVFDKTPTMKMIRDKWSQMDLAVTGIGFAPTSRGLDRETYIGEHELHKQLIADMAAGDICARYFEESGKIIRGDIYDLVIGVPVEVLKETKQVICIAVGKDKVEAITGALRTGIIDTLITDERTGMAVLQHQSAKSDH